ncbi:MAG: hypothetical protein R3B06_12350 [Kofleriaceae bacterium]
MELRRLATLVATWLMALGVVVALPVAQLEVAAAATSACCCPSPASCRCPDHHPTAGQPTTLRPCRQASTEAPRLAAFVLAVAPAVPTIPTASIEAFFTVPMPHPAPPPARRAAPA